MLIQESLWDKIHNRDDWVELNFTPNLLAMELQKILPEKSNILEIGCSRGRDARYLASHGHSVVAVDFSTVALTQMMELVKQQGCDSQITPIHHNIMKGLPTVSSDSFDCFYSRSSLHVDDEKMIVLAKSIDLVMKKGGLIAIEGRMEIDTPIQESEKIEGGLAVNWKESGHVRRVWKKEFCLQLARDFSWEVMTLLEYEDDVGNKKHLLRFIARKGLKT